MFVCIGSCITSFFVVVECGCHGCFVFVFALHVCVVFLHVLLLGGTLHCLFFLLDVCFNSMLCVLLCACFLVFLIF